VSCASLSSLCALPPSVHVTSPCLARCQSLACTGKAFRVPVAMKRMNAAVCHGLTFPVTPLARSHHRTGQHDVLPSLTGMRLSVRPMPSDGMNISDSEPSATSRAVPGNCTVYIPSPHHAA